MGKLAAIGYVYSVTKKYEVVMHMSIVRRLNSQATSATRSTALKVHLVMRGTKPALRISDIPVIRASHTQDIELYILDCSNTELNYHWIFSRGNKTVLPDLAMHHVFHIKLSVRICYNPNDASPQLIVDPRSLQYAPFNIKRSVQIRYNRSDSSRQLLVYPANPQYSVQRSPNPYLSPSWPYHSK